MDLGNPNNWSKIQSWSLRGSLVQQYGSGVGALQVYDPIPSQESSIATPVGLLRTIAPLDEIKSKWFKACRISAYLAFTNQPVKDAIYSKVCGLNQGTFLQLPDFGIYPYQLKIEIPEWIISLDIDLWQFTSTSGSYDQANQSAILSAVEVVEQRTQELKTTIDFIANRDVVKDYTVNPG